MTRGTLLAFPATETAVSQFRQLMFIVFASGAIAGFALFVVQHFTVGPLIETAETYEEAQHANSGTTHEEEGWQPAGVWERTSYTAITTILSGIGLAAILFGSLSLAGTQVNARRGALWGLAAFACFGLAPAIGLPPQPPGTTVASVPERQLWWIGTAVATSAGLWMLAGEKRSWLLRIAGVVCLLLPHLIGAPNATGQNTVPPQLVRRFTIASLATTCVFWLLVGTIGGFLWSRAYEPDQRLRTQT